MFLIPLIPLFRWPASLHRWCEDQQSSLLVQDGGVKASWALHSCHLTVWEEQHHPLHTESLCHLWLLPHTLHRSLQESVWEKSKCVLCGCVCVCVSVCVFVFIIYVWRITWLLLHSSITHNFYISKYKKKKKSMYSPHWKKGEKKEILEWPSFKYYTLLVLPDCWWVERSKRWRVCQQPWHLQQEPLVPGQTGQQLHWQPPHDWAAWTQVSPMTPKPKGPEWIAVKSFDG